jgi:hypothetical protein
VSRPAKAALIGAAGIVALVAVSALVGWLLSFTGPPPQP